MINPWGGAVEYRAVTSSTMDEAVAMERSGAPDGTVVWAGTQTQGRGRHADRRWETAPGQALLMTAFWSASRFVSSIAPSLTIGLAVSRWLESFSITPRIKWPNDVYLNGGKVAGILVRQFWEGGAGPRSIHAGIGVNLLPPPAEVTYRNPPVSLADAGVRLLPEQALESLLPFLAQGLEETDVVLQVRDRLWKLNEPWEAQWDGRPLETGIVRGLDDRGRLLWETEGQTFALESSS